MEELIKIKIDDDGSSVVSAKDLYNLLGFDKSQWSRWASKNIEENQFAIENQDWAVFDIKSSSNNGASTKDFALTIDFAKRLAMLARTEKGEAVRNYFIECEKKLQPQFKIPQTYSEALRLASEQAETIEKQQVLISEQTPKVQAFENIIDSANTYTLDSVSDILNIGRTTLSKMLEERKWKTVKEKHGTASTRYSEENGYAKTIYEYIRVGKVDIKTKRFVLKKKGLEKLIKEYATKSE